MLEVNRPLAICIVAIPTANVYHVDSILPASPNQTMPFCTWCNSYTPQDFTKITPAHLAVAPEFDLVEFRHHRPRPLDSLDHEPRAGLIAELVLRHRDHFLSVVFPKKKQSTCAPERTAPPDESVTSTCSEPSVGGNSNSWPPRSKSEGTFASTAQRFLLSFICRVHRLCTLGLAPAGKLLMLASQVVVLACSCSFKPLRQKRITSQKFLDPGSASQLRCGSSQVGSRHLFVRRHIFGIAQCYRISPRKPSFASAPHEQEGSEPHTQVSGAPPSVNHRASPFLPFLLQSTFLVLEGSQGRPRTLLNSSVSQCFSGLTLTAELRATVPTVVDITCSSVPKRFPNHIPRRHLGFMSPFGPWTLALTQYWMDVPNSSVRRV